MYAYGNKISFEKYLNKKQISTDNQRLYKIENDDYKRKSNIDYFGYFGYYNYIRMYNYIKQFNEC